MASYIPGARVSQGNYGTGTVLESNEYHTVIDFDEHGVRRFVTTIVDLKTTTVPGSGQAKRAKARRKVKT